MAAAKSLALTAQAGDRVATLYALRDLLAAQIQACESGRDVAALSLRLMDALTQIAELEKVAPAPEGTGLSEFERRRAQRETTGARSPAKRKQRG